MRSYYIFPIKESEPIATIGIYEGVKKVEEIDVCIGKPCDKIDIKKTTIKGGTLELYRLAAIHCSD
jgi:hypothetical protein